MKKEYYLAVRASTDSGSISEDNFSIIVDEPLTDKVLQKSKQEYCRLAFEKGFKCSPDKVVIFSVVPLDA